MNTASTSQIAVIHMLASKARMDEDTYRSFLLREGGASSTKKLTPAAAGRVIDRLRTIVREPTWAKGAVAGLDTPIARKLQALWLTGYNLGLIHDRTDRAMLAFLERQTGISHTLFLNHPSEATPAVQALKSWLRRDGGVEWPIETRRGDIDIGDLKQAVLDAQWRRLVELDDAFRTRDLAAFASKITHRRIADFESAHFDQVQKALGVRIRAALAQRKVGG